MEIAMRKLIVPGLMFAAALAFSGSADAKPKLDGQGRCRDHGNIVDAQLCEGQTKPGQRCRDKETKKSVKCNAPNSEPVPEKPKSAGERSFPMPHLIY